MAYIVKQKIKGRIYLYNVEAYWDKEKKQSRQKRIYIGPEEPKNKMYKKNLEVENSGLTKQVKNIVHKNFGNIIFLSFLINKLNIKSLIEKHFPEDSEDIFGLIMYEIINNEASYLYQYWQEDHYLPGNKKLSSTEISSLYRRIGENQKAMLDFQKDWIQNIASNDAVFFDITSFSSYSKNIETVEMGYNRDGENLKQINMGAVFSSAKSLPLFYKTYPGSIVDVSTLKNTAKYMQGFGIADYMFVLDRGFYSGLNITDLEEKNIDFLIPVPFSVKASRELIKQHRKELHNQKNYFVNGKETLSYVKSEISINNNNYDAHIFLNEKIELEQRHKLIQELKGIETRISKMTFESAKKATEFKKENIKNSFQKLFKWDNESKNIKINSSEFNKHISKFGYFILITNKKGLARDFVLSKYRDKDEVEKAFNIVKNEMDGNRLRVHSQTNTDAKLFVRFLALIVHSEIIRVMRKNDMFKKFTVKELMLELKKIKHTKINSEIIISEISKKQKEIYKTFDMDWKKLDSY
jgi:transposase